MRKFTLILILCIAAFGMVPAQAQDDNTETLRFFLPFIPNIQFAPLYVMEAEGYSAEEGLSLQFEYGDENIGVEQIAIGDLDFGMIGGEQVILARAGERPVVFVYEWFQTYPIGVMVPSTVEVEDVADLSGLRVGVPGRFGSSYSGLTALLSVNGLSEGDINLESIGFNAPDVICLGAVDVATIYVNNEPLQVQLRADRDECGDISEVDVIPVADYVDLVSNGIVTSEAVIAENPELVAAVVSAFDLALLRTINNPAAAYLDSIEFVENLPASTEFVVALETAATETAAFLETEPDAEAIAEQRAAVFASLSETFPAEDLVQFEVLLRTIELWEADTLGLTDPASWTVTQDVLIEIESMSDAIDLDAAFTNEFVEAAE